MVLVFRRKSSIFWESRLSGPAVRGLAGRGWGQMAYFEFAEGAGGTPALPVGGVQSQGIHTSGRIGDIHSRLQRVVPPESGKPAKVRIVGMHCGLAL